MIQVMLSAPIPSLAARLEGQHLSIIISTIREILVLTGLPPGEVPLPDLEMGFLPLDPVTLFRPAA